jgi:hypothetical protein
MVSPIEDKGGLSGALMSPKVSKVKVRELAGPTAINKPVQTGSDKTEVTVGPGGGRSRQTSVPGICRPGNGLVDNKHVPRESQSETF